MGRARAQAPGRWARAPSCGVPSAAQDSMQRQCPVRRLGARQMTACESHAGNVPLYYSVCDHRSLCEWRATVVNPGSRRRGAADACHSGQCVRGAGAALRSIARYVSCVL